MCRGLVDAKVCRVFHHGHSLHSRPVPLDPINCMSPASPPPEAIEPGQLLKELEQRQDDVLAQIDELDEKVRQVLQGLGVSLDESDETLS